MHPVAALERLGGVATSSEVLRLTSRKRLRTAVRHREVVALGGGRVGLPGLERDRRAAAELGGVLVELSAAQRHGWSVKTVPPRPVVAVPRNRNVRPGASRGVDLRRRLLDPDDVSDRVTRPLRTALDCAGRLPFDEALAVVDSALRSGVVERDQLLAAAAREPTLWRSRSLRVVSAADPQAANPFESVLRAIALEVPGLHVVAQQWIDGVGQPDLVDHDLGLVIEADSWEFHGERSMLTRDCERYNALVALGWVVLRFAYEHVMQRPDYVRQVLLDVVARLEGPDRREGPAAAPPLPA